MKRKHLIKVGLLSVSLSFVLGCSSFAPVTFSFADDLTTATTTVEEKQLPLAFIITGLDGRRTQVDASMVDMQGQSLAGAYNQYHQWKTANPVKPETYVLTFASLPEGSKAIEIDSDSLRNVEVSPVEDKPLSFNMKVLKAKPSFGFSAFYGAFKLVAGEPEENKDPSPDTNPQPTDPETPAQPEQPAQPTKPAEGSNSGSSVLDSSSLPSWVYAALADKTESKDPGKDSAAASKASKQNAVKKSLPKTGENRSSTLYLALGSALLLGGFALRRIQKAQHHVRH